MVESGPSLADAWAKLNWARHDYEMLRLQIVAFEDNHDYRMRCEVNAEEGVYRFYAEGFRPLGNEWGLMIGDCVHNARSALDYVVVQLVALKTSQHPRDITDVVEFPISLDPAKF